MDDQNTRVNERWAPAGSPPERGYSRDEARESDAGGAGERSTREIRSEIEQTRADMGETIDEIQDRLRPSNVVSRATESVREAAVEKVRDMAHSAQDAFTGRSRQWNGYDDYEESYGIMDRIREHPVPATLAAISLAWLAFSRRDHRYPSQRAIYGSTAYGDPSIRETRITGAPGSRSSYRGEGGAYGYGEARSGEYGRAGHEAAEGVRHAAGEIRHAAGETAARVGEATRHAGYEMRRTTRRTTHRIERMVRRNPLAVGAMAAAVGATIGLIVPETRREQELMGDTRDQLLDKAKDAAVEAKERVEQAAVRAQDAAQKAATETLTGGDTSKRE
jgi:ElaB/YqjD/DUF883 family membrane-anchored ribosome-binding protein